MRFGSELTFWGSAAGSTKSALPPCCGVRWCWRCWRRPQMLASTPPLKVAHSSRSSVYDMAVSPGDGWKLMTHQDFTNTAPPSAATERAWHASDRPFRAGNCCVEWAVPR